MREANSGTGTPGHSGGPCCGHLASGCEMEVAPYNDYQRQDTGCDPDAQARAASGHDGADPGHHACSAENLSPCAGSASVAAGRDRGCRRAPFHAGVDEQAVERVWVGALDLRYLPGWKPRLSGSLRGGRRRARWPRRSGPLGAWPSAARADPDDRRCATWRPLSAATRVGGRRHVPGWCPAFRCVVALR